MGVGAGVGVSVASGVGVGVVVGCGVGSVFGVSTGAGVLEISTLGDVFSSDAVTSGWGGVCSETTGVEGSSPEDGAVLHPARNRSTTNKGSRSFNILFIGDVSSEIL